MLHAIRRRAQRSTESSKVGTRPHGIEFVGATAHFPDGSEGNVDLSRSSERRDKVAEQLLEILRLVSASEASTRTVAGQLRFAQTAAMGKFGRVALKLLLRFIAGKGGGCRDKW